MTTPASARTRSTVRLVVFPGGFNWPVWVAQDKRMFARRGIDVEVTDTPGSVFQLTGLIEGRFDVAITLIDNVVAYREGQGEVPAVGPDLVGFMAADTRVYPALVTLPEIRRYEDLRGQTLSVDALKTGYALVLRAMLEHGGLAPGDYTLDSIGGAQQRYLALGERRHAGCLLNSPFERLLAARGYRILDTAIAVLGRYQGQVAAARRSWLVSHRDAALGFTRAFVDAVRWLYDPANRGEAFDIFIARTGGTRDAAATAYGVLCDDALGFPRDGAIDLGAVARVVELRARYGEPRRALGRPEDYVDQTILPQALGRT